MGSNELLIKSREDAAHDQMLGLTLQFYNNFALPLPFSLPSSNAITYTICQKT